MNGDGLLRRIAICSTLAAGCALAAGGPASLAGERDDGKHHDVKSKIKIVRVGEDGERHEDSFEWDGDSPRAFLGVMTEAAKDGGARVTEVLRDTPAEGAGLEEGDVIVAFDEREIDDSTDLLRAVLESEPDQDVAIEVLRDGDRRTLDVRLGERSSNDLFGLAGPLIGGKLQGLDLPSLHGLAFLGRPKLGVELVEPTPELREHFGAPADAGVIVGKVLPGMPAETAGVQVGDVIVSVDGESIGDAGDLIRELYDSDGRTIELELIRDGRSQRLDVYIPDRDEDVPTGPRA